MPSISLGFSSMCLGCASIVEAVEVVRNLDFDHIEILYGTPCLIYSGGDDIYQTLIL